MRKGKLNIKIVVFITAIIFFLILSTTMSKYVFKLEDTHQIESVAFYFNSNIAENYTEDWDGKSNIKIGFDVNNYDNTKLVTPEDIKYNIQVEKLDDLNNDIIAEICENDTKISSEQNLTGNLFENKNYTLNISAQNENISVDEFNLKVKVTSETPYKKEIVGNIKINMQKMNNEIENSLTDGGEYVALNIKTNDYIADKTIRFDNTELVLDKSNNLLKDVEINTTDNLSSFTITKSNFELDTEYKINFIKIDSSSQIELGKDIIVN